MKQFCVYLGLNVLATMIFYRLFHRLTNVHSMQVKEAGTVNIRKYGLFFCMGVVQRLRFSYSMLTAPLKTLL